MNLRLVNTFCEVLTTRTNDLYQNRVVCAKNYSDEKFTILSFGRSSFHLSALEVVYIKSFKPNLCRQKEFVYNFKFLCWSSVVTLLSYNQSSSSSFITKSIEFFFPSFRRLSPDECLMKSLEMNFLLVIFKFCTTNQLLRTLWNEFPHFFSFFVYIIG